MSHLLQKSLMENFIFYAVTMFSFDLVIFQWIDFYHVWALIYYLCYILFIFVFFFFHSLACSKFELKKRKKRNKNLTRKCVNFYLDIGPGF